MDMEEVVEEYKNGDEAKRLGLFLTYRELREDFSRIEQNSPHDDFTILKFPWSRKHDGRQAA